MNSSSNMDKWGARVATALGMSMLIYIASTSAKISGSIDLHAQSILELQDDVAKLERSVDEKANTSHSSMKEVFQIKIESLARRVIILENKVSGGGMHSR